MRLPVALLLLFHHSMLADSRQLPDADAMLDEIFETMDANKDGMVTAKEFAAVSDEGDALDAFKLLDTDGDGLATRAEIAAELARVMKDEL